MMSLKIMKKNLLTINNKTRKRAEKEKENKRGRRMKKM
jgi:hypothetical protein